MEFFWAILYNILFIPPAFIGLHFAALFNLKIRKGIIGRRQSWKDLERFRKKHPNQELFLVHSASLGEFEQAKPVIRGLKTLRPDILIVASFTSPSGYEHAVRIPEADLFIYLPLDTLIRIRRFIQKLKPSKMIFVSYELWPNLILNALRYRIPTYLISARINQRSLKWKPVIRNFFTSLYRSLNYIYAVSDADRLSVQKLMGNVHITLLTLGDTRYDQVIQRARQQIHKTLPKLFENGFTFIAGSVWPQDIRHLLPALIKALKHFPDLKVVIAPHEPNSYVLEMLEDNFTQLGVAVARLTDFQRTTGPVQVILVDRVGILAELYHQCQLAFIGGSFRSAIHNVMEPAVAGIPILFGPLYHNSHEAEMLLTEGGAFCCPDQDCLYDKIVELMGDSKVHQQASESARQVILQNLGASARTVKEILESHED
jgi:3-deoxy-D-manno-octulosonic-acid transferase